MGSVSYGLGANLSISLSLSSSVPVCLPVDDDRYLNLGSQKRPTGRNLGGSLGTTLWHHVQRYCCLGVSFVHAQVRSNCSSYHIRGNEMNCVGSSEYTSFTRASFLNDADKTFSLLIRTFFSKNRSFYSHFALLYIWSTIVIDKDQPRVFFICVPSCGISGQSLMHTGDHILDTQWSALYSWFWLLLLHVFLLACVAFHFHKLLFPCEYLASIQTCLLP